ncbi:Gfo/Idh/MocA family protein [Aliihoeflea sp. PC F10.4]
MASIAHMGYGYWGRNIARNLASLGALGAIIDPHEPSAQEGAQALGTRAITFEDALRDDAITGFSIASPAELHFDLARRALEAGKHVFVEKPLALDTNEAEALCELADTNNIVLMVGHLLQYHPVYLELRRMVEAGELGKVSYAYSNRMSLGKFRREENVLWSFAPHDISMLLGLIPEEPVAVSAQGHVAYTPGVADFATAQMKFAGGASAHVQVSWMHPFKEQRLVVIGDKGMAVFEDSAPAWEDKLIAYDHKIDSSGPVPVPTKAEGRRIEVTKSEPLKDECRHFLDCIASGARPRTDGREGLRVLRVLEAAEQALKANLGLDANRGDR